MKKIFLSAFVIFIFSFFLFFCFPSSKAQNESTPARPGRPDFFATDEKAPKQIPRLINDYKAGGLSFESRDLFQAAKGKVSQNKQLNSVIAGGLTLTLDQPAVRRLLQEKANFITLPLPDEKGGTLELELARVDIFAPGFTVSVSSPTGEPVDGNTGIHYRGIIKGDDRSLAAISVFDDEVMGFYSTATDGNTVLGRLGGSNPTNKHVLYAERDLRVSSNFHCDTKDSEMTLPERALEVPGSGPEATDGVLRCVKIHLEANYDLFLNKGSVSAVTSYLIGLFNQSATLYANEGIPVSISDITVWNSTSPYTGTTSSDVLTQYKNTRTSFSGDLAHLFTLDKNFGGIAYLDVLCVRSFAYGVSDIDPTYQTVPTYSWSVNVFTHEVGHNLGSPHTHACAWNGNNTQIDSCGPTAGYPESEATCPLGPLPSQNGGTVMSYCNLLGNVGINFALGFGPQPSALIVSRYNSATCLTECNSDCIFILSPAASSTFAAAGGSGSFTVSTRNICSWTATPTYSFAEKPAATPQSMPFSSLKDNSSIKKLLSPENPEVSPPIDNDVPVDSWITVTAGSSGQGNGTVSYSVAANTTATQRTGTITVGGRIHTVTQAAGSGGGSGGCSLTRLIYGQTIGGILNTDCVYANTTKYVDLYTFSGTAGQTISISMNSTAFDTYLYLLNSNNQVLTDDNNSGGGTNSRIPSLGFYTLPATGTYTIQATSFSADRTGSYSLTLNIGIAHNRKTAGVFRPSNGITYLKNSNTGGAADIGLVYGVSGDKSFAGDWNGDGVDSIGIYRDGIFYLRNSNTTGPADVAFAFGAAGDQPVAGDWNGDGTDTIGVYRPSTGVFYLRNSNTTGPAEITFVLGNPGDVAIAGDWNGDGITTTGVFRPSNGIIYLKNTNISGNADGYLVYGVAGDKPVAGDWDGDGTDTIGIYRNGVFYLRNSNTAGVADLVFALGNAGDEPIAGDWDGLF